MPTAAELAFEEEGYLNRFNYAFAGGAAVFFALLIAPYRDIHIPRALMLSLYFTVGLLCLKYVRDDFPKILLLFTVYAPFQKVLPGDLAGFMTAFNLTNVLAVFILLGWLSRSSFREEPIYKRRAADIPLLVFCFLSSIALIRGGILSDVSSIGEFAVQLKRWLLPMFMYYAFVNTVNSKETLKQIVVSVSITTGLIGALGVKEFYMDMGGFSSTFASYRSASISVITDQPNQLGAFFSYYTFYLAAFFLVNLTVKRYWLLLPAILFCGRSLLLTFSRGGQVSFTVGGVALMYLWNKKVFFLVLVPLALLLILYPSLVPGILAGRLGDTLHGLREGADDKLVNPLAADGPRLDKSAETRLKVWKAGVYMAKDRPLLGFGFGQFPRQIGRYAPELNQVDAHNTYLLVATELGLPALLIFLLVLGIFARNAWLVYRHSNDKFLRTFSMGYLAGLAGLLVANVFGSRLNTSEIVFQFWILSAMIMRAREYSDEESPATQTEELAE